jgi:hypothetical protein
MYEMGRQFVLCNVAGFSHWDGPEVFDKLKVGAPLGEPDNPYDPNAVAVLLDGTKIGYVPRKCNSVIAQLMFYGHEDVFYALVASIDPEEDLEHRVTMSIRVTDVRQFG